MGFINKIFDRFKSAEFTVAPNKKLKSISTDFKNAFGLTLVFYKGKMIADGNLTLAGLDRRTSKEVKTSNKPLKIKASTKVGEAESMFDSHFGVTVQVKDPLGKHLVNDDQTLGQAARSFQV